MKKILLIGAGGRSVAFVKSLMLRDDAQVWGIADPSQRNMKNLVMKTNLTDPFKEFDNHTEALQDGRDIVDGIIITTPNYLHVTHCIEALELQIPILLEKPVATDIVECGELLTAIREKKARVAVGFVLRSTPYFMEIKRLVSSGTIGRIISIQADELPGMAVTSIIRRNPWRRSQELSGGALLEKACHDLDILNWLCESRPLMLNSIAGRNIFSTREKPAERCSECPPDKQCRYYREPQEEIDAKSDHDDLLSDFIDTGDKDLCLYSEESDTYDVQSVQIQYENSIIVNFMLNFNTQGKKRGRNIHIIGTEGRLWGNLDDALVQYQHIDSSEVISIEIETDGSGHHGGDNLNTFNLLKMIDDPNFEVEYGIYAGYMSAMTALAADVSAQKEKRVIFSYNELGEIELN
jgi:predicted dehydrogenase